MNGQTSYQPIPNEYDVDAHVQRGMDMYSKFQKRGLA